MKKLNNTIKIWGLAALSSMVMLTSCNKALDSFTPIATPTYPVGNIPGSLSIARTLAANPNDSMFYRMLVRSGLLNNYNDSTKNLTLFAVDNAGMKVFVNAASGGAVPLAAPDAVFAGFISGTLPAATAAAIIQYNTLGQKYPFANFGATFPNYPAPTLFQLDPVNTPFLRMTICPTNTSAFKYVNNIPATGQLDVPASNGTIHHTFTVVAPPSMLLKGLIATKPNLSYFRAAIARADSGSVGLGRLDSLLNFGALNMTVLPPSDAAFQTLIFGLVFSNAISAGAPPALANTLATNAVAAGPAFLGTNNVSTALVKGIVAYHFIATKPVGAASFSPNIRVFSVDVPTTPAFVTTLINGSVAAHPGIRASAVFTGPVATTVNFTGLGTFPPGGAAFSGAPAAVIDADNHAVNGVFHTIDKVLFPQ